MSTINFAKLFLFDIASEFTHPTHAYSETIITTYGINRKANKQAFQ